MKNVMFQKSGLSGSTLKIVIDSLQTEIQNHKDEIAKLEDVILELQGKKNAAPLIPPRRRLAIGMPKKLVIEALKKYGDLTISELRYRIHQDTQHTIRDGSARRVLEDLMEKGIVKKIEETGAYKLVE